MVAVTDLNCDECKFFVLTDFQFVHFLRFQAKESVSGCTQCKSSVQKGIRSKLKEQYPAIEDHLDVILPKKEPLMVVKW